MSVAYASADPFPYVCAAYVCACGRAATAHGRRAGRLPRGWLLLGPAGAAEPVCPDCVPGRSSAA